MDERQPDTAEGRLAELFRQHTGTKPDTVALLAGDGSDRRIYRLVGRGQSLIGVSHGDEKENRAFVTFSRHFRRHGLRVPEILVEDLAHGVYLEDDLGDTMLFDLVTADRLPGQVSRAAEAIYRDALSALPIFQVVAGRTLDYSVCHPRDCFDRQSMMWDLNYFKYNFLKLVRIPFDEQRLERDFASLADFLLEAGTDCFLYRDLQSRNIMVVDGRAWFIDYQGGRRGALHYDVASLLFDPKADLPPALRETLLAHYLDALAEHQAVDPNRFRHHYHAFVLIRLMQAMGAFGYRGIHERRPQFIQSVPFAARTVESLLGELRLPLEVPELREVLARVARAAHLREMGQVRLPLTVTIRSFSYRHGLPDDPDVHGGGFVFDCRALPNPGRQVAFASRTGLDAEVAAWLAAEESVHGFMTHARALVDQAIDAYLERNFSRLSVAFGCTGGLHRSVYCASRLAEHLRRRREILVEVSHRDMPPASRWTT